MLQEPLHCFFRRFGGPEKVARLSGSRSLCAAKSGLHKKDKILKTQMGKIRFQPQLHVVSEYPVLEGLLGRGSQILRLTVAPSVSWAKWASLLGRLQGGSLLHWSEEVQRGDRDRVEKDGSHDLTTVLGK